MGTITLIVGQPPVARNLSLEIPAGTALNVTAANGLVAVNGDTGGAAHLSGRTPAGLILHVDGSFSLPATSMMAGNRYTFSYYIANADGISNVDTVSITVDDPGPIDLGSGPPGGHHVLS